MKIFTQLVLLFSASALLAQVSANKKTFTMKREAVVNLGEIKTDFAPKLLVMEMPKQRGEKMEKYNYPENYKLNNANKTASPPLSSLTLGQSFSANNWGLSTPNDNDMAISDSGIVISVINTNIYVKNTITNFTNSFKSLSVFTQPVNNNHQEFDPKVMYDPLRDRFVLVCLVGSLNTTSKIIIGYSQTSDPNGNWNLYTLPGNPLNNSLWTDYPMISMTEKELFLTVNLLVDNMPWQTGFVETVVWQMKKDSGYAGLPSIAVLHNNIKFNGKNIRNLCPVKGGSKLHKPNMYFVSNRNLASQNDSVFLVNITDTIGAPTGTLTAKVMISNQPYYFPPPGTQTVTTDSLATNDCRNLGAFLENGQIQYVHNTANPSNSLCSVYYGIITSPASASPVATGYIIPNDTVNFAYPNISYAGKNNTDNTAIITFDHASRKINAGVSAIKADGLGNYSPVLRIKNGDTHVNLLTGSLERWGDYSGSQLKYNNPGEIWMSGYTSYFYSNPYPYVHRGWVAQIGLDPGLLLSTKNTAKETNSGALVFPNPAKDIFSVELNLTQPEDLTFELFDQQGKLIKILLQEWVKIKYNVFSFSTRDLSAGLYILKITGNKTGITKKVVVN